MPSPRGLLLCGCVPRALAHDSPCGLLGRPGGSRPCDATMGCRLSGPPRGPHPPPASARRPTPPGGGVEKAVPVVDAPARPGVEPPAGSPLRVAGMSCRPPPPGAGSPASAARPRPSWAAAPLRGPRPVRAAPGARALAPRVRSFASLCGSAALWAPVDLPFSVCDSPPPAPRWPRPSARFVLWRLGPLRPVDVVSAAACAPSVARGS